MSRELVYDISWQDQAAQEKPVAATGPKHHYDLEQGSDEWLQIRCGMLTASTMKNIITPKTLKAVKGVENGTSAFLFDLVSQKISGYVEPHYMSDDMLRGHADEIDAVILYDKHYSMLERVGFVTNDKWGFTLGYSPDALVDTDGAIEVKSRRQKYQVETIIADKMPDEYMIQVQTGLLVSERKWCDFITYSGGLPMFTKRVFPDAEIQEAIINAATLFHKKMDAMIETYHDRLKAPGARFLPTKRKAIEEITL